MMTPLTELTPAEEEALNAVKAAGLAINRPWLTLTMVHDYACLTVSAFAAAMGSLEAKGRVRRSAGCVQAV